MFAHVFQLFAWLPPLLQVVVCGVIAIFLVFSILKIAQIIMDIIPFF